MVRGMNLLNVSSTTEPIRHRIGSVVELTFNKSVIPRVRTVGAAILALFSSIQTLALPLSQYNVVLAQW
jgi:hypothetical protein